MNDKTIFSDKHRENIRKAKLEKPRSEEVKKKISEGMKKRWREYHEKQTALKLQQVNVVNKLEKRKRVLK